MSNVIYLAGRDQPAGILLVESDPLARMAAAGHLRKAGLTVLEATDGVEALTLLRAGRTLSLVFGELDSPGHGFDLMAALKGEFPEVNLLLARRPYDLPEIEQAVKALLGWPPRP